tara:strand:- start:190 stop:453 length:264 start_codon:yes stop_codon:yes gene_type:complete
LGIQKLKIGKIRKFQQKILTQRLSLMKFKCVFVNKRTNKIINKDFTVAQIDKYMGEYIKDRAIKRGHTTTTVVKRGDNWKVTITYSK